MKIREVKIAERLLEQLEDELCGWPLEPDLRKVQKFLTVNVILTEGERK